jgi:hypothetical protein
MDTSEQGGATASVASDDSDSLTREQSQSHYSFFQLESIGAGVSNPFASADFDWETESLVLASGRKISAFRHQVPHLNLRSNVPGTCRSVHIVCNGKAVLVTCVSGEIHLFAFEEDQLALKQSIMISPAGILRAERSGDSHTVVVCDRAGAVFVMRFGASVTDLPRMQRVRTGEGLITAMTVSHDGCHVAWCSKSGALTYLVLDAETGHVLSTDTSAVQVNLSCRILCCFIGTQCIVVAVGCEMFTFVLDAGSMTLSERINPMHREAWLLVGNDTDACVVTPDSFVCYYLLDKVLSRRTPGWISIPISDPAYARMRLNDDGQSALFVLSGDLGVAACLFDRKASSWEFNRVGLASRVCLSPDDLRIAMFRQHDRCIWVAHGAHEMIKFSAPLKREPTDMRYTADGLHLCYADGPANVVCMRVPVSEQDPIVVKSARCMRLRSVHGNQLFCAVNAGISMVSVDIDCVATALGGIRDQFADFDVSPDGATIVTARTDNIRGPRCIIVDFFRLRDTTLSLLSSVQYDHPMIQPRLCFTLNGSAVVVASRRVVVIDTETHEPRDSDVIDACDVRPLADGESVVMALAQDTGLVVLNARTRLTVARSAEEIPVLMPIFDVSRSTVSLVLGGQDVCRWSLAPPRDIIHLYHIMTMVGAELGDGSRVVLPRDVFSVVMDFLYPGVSVDWAIRSMLRSGTAPIVQTAVFEPERKCVLL